MNWQVIFSKHALKDANKLAAHGLKPKAFELLTTLERDPFQNPPPYEKPVDVLAGAYSAASISSAGWYYEVFANAWTVRVLRMWTHYE